MCFSVFGYWSLLILQSQNLQDPKRCRNSGVASPDTPSDLPAGATSITSDPSAPIGLESASVPMQSTNSGLPELTTGTTSSRALHEGSGASDGFASPLSQVPISDLSNVAGSVSGQETGSGISSSLSRIVRMDGVSGASGRAVPTASGGLSGVPDHTTRAIDSSNSPTSGTSSSDISNLAGDATSGGPSSGLGRSGISRRDCTTDRDGDPAAYANTQYPHTNANSPTVDKPQDSSSGSDDGSTSSDTPNTSDGSGVDSSRAGYGSFPIQTSSDSSGTRYGSQSTGYGGGVGRGSNAETGHSAASNTAGSSLEGGPRYPEVFPSATDPDHPDHESDRGVGGIGGGKGVSGGSDAGDNNRSDATDGGRDPAAYANTQYPGTNINSPTAPHDSSSGSDKGSTSSSTPNTSDDPRPQSTGHGGVGGSDAGDDRRFGATDGDADQYADTNVNSPTTPHGSSSDSDNGSTSSDTPNTSDGSGVDSSRAGYASFPTQTSSDSSGTRYDSQSTGHGGDMGYGLKGDTGYPAAFNTAGRGGEGSPRYPEVFPSATNSDSPDHNSGHGSGGVGGGGGVSGGSDTGDDSRFGATVGEGDPAANSPTAVDTPHDSDSNSGSDNGSTSRGGTPNPRPQSTGHGGGMGGSDAGDDSSFGDGDPAANSPTAVDTPHDSSSSSGSGSDIGSTSSGTPNTSDDPRPQSTGHEGGIRGSDTATDGEGDPAAYANTRYPDTNANSPTAPHGSSSGSDNESTSSGTPNTPNDSRPQSTGHGGGMGYGSKADTGYPAAFNTAGSGQEGGPRYPEAFPSTTNSDSPGDDSDRGSSGVGAGKGVSGGSDTGDDSGFGANQRNASGSAACTDEVTCTDIHVDNENIGKAETAPTVGYTQSNLVKGVALPEVREKETGCPGGDINACLDGSVIGGR